MYHNAGTHGNSTIATKVAYIKIKKNKLEILCDHIFDLQKHYRPLKDQEQIDFSIAHKLNHCLPLSDNLCDLRLMFAA